MSSTTSVPTVQPEESLPPNDTSAPAATSAPAPVPSHLTFPDGDVVLKSCDGKEFRVHSVILREASTVFRDMFKMPDGGSRDQSPIPMTESGEVLDDLLRWLYPIATAPTIITIDQALALLRTVEKFQIESHAIDGALTAYVNKQQNPLRAWALATRFDLMEARKTATRRILMTSGELLDDIPTEMDIVDAKSYMRLLRVKRDAIIWARTIISTGLVDCDNCARPGGSPYARGESQWHSKYYARISAGNPFDATLTSDLMVEMYVSAHGALCCKDRFKPGRSHARMMHELRFNLHEVLRKAVQSECHGTKFT